jgi:hypothetical protein
VHRQVARAEALLAGSQPGWLSWAQIACITGIAANGRRCGVSGLDWAKPVVLRITAAPTSSSQSSTSPGSRVLSGWPRRSATVGPPPAALAEHVDEAVFRLQMRAIEQHRRHRFGVPSICQSLRRRCLGW